MKEKATQNSNNDEDTTMSDALTQAAQLAAVSHDEPVGEAPMSDTDTSSESEENGEVVEAPAEVQPAQGKKRKPKHTKEMPAAKRSNDTGVQKAKKRRKPRKTK